MTPTLRDATAWRLATGRTKGPLTLRDHRDIERWVEAEKYLKPGLTIPARRGIKEAR